MIAKILQGSSSFSAVDYNEKKVKQGTAELLEAKGFPKLHGGLIATGGQYKEWFMMWSSANSRIKYPQFHVAISCEGKTYSKEQLVDIAHQWLEKMGYKDIPTLIYFHHDTDNNHLHIVTSRVDPNGKKVDHNHERIRALKAIEEIMGVNRKKDVDKHIENAFSYSFANINQFRSILECSGYETYVEGDNVCVKRGGEVQKRIPVEQIQNAAFMDAEKYKQRKKQLEAWIRKYKDSCSSKEELQKVMKEKFGMSIIFHGKEFSPYGYTVVDHNAKMVFKGSDIMPVKELIVFKTNDQWLNGINSFIMGQIELNDAITDAEVEKP